MRVIKHTSDTSNISYYLCSDVEEYGAEYDRWVSLKNYIPLTRLPEDNSLFKIIWKHVKHNTGLCTRLDKIEDITDEIFK